MGISRFFFPDTPLFSCNDTDTWAEGSSASIVVFVSVFGLKFPSESIRQIGTPILGLDEFKQSLKSLIVDASGGAIDRQDMHQELDILQILAASGDTPQR